PAQIAHREGKRVARAAALVGAATGMQVRLDTLDAELARGASARFPLKAADLTDAGMAPGPALGAALARAAAAWLASDFTLDRAALLRVATGEQ
ncbi:MAG: CbbQ/NirQ/NorQ C-terminal domain-containing protein, partial [Acidiferrobacterales bacterium]|nr:CbbQ/NirQ/NorQ C-terminal domain-containing protein [Acidiferrobacterales bacterium]